LCQQEIGRNKKKLGGFPAVGAVLPISFPGVSWETTRRGGMQMRRKRLYPGCKGIETSRTATADWRGGVFAVNKRAS